MVEEGTAMVTSFALAKNAVRALGSRSQAQISKQERLRCKLVTLEKENATAERIAKIASSTGIDGTVESVYEIERRGARERFEPFRCLPEPKMLWYPIQACDVAGIMALEFSIPRQKRRAGRFHSERSLNSLSLAPMP